MKYRLRYKFLQRIVSCSIIILVGTVSYIYGQDKRKNIIDETLVRPRIRVIIDNDFGGDPDGLFPLVHLLLSPSVELKGIIASQNYDGGFYGYPGDVSYSAKVASELLATMGLQDEYSVYKGSGALIESAKKQSLSEGVDFIIKEAMRQDEHKPLYIVCGGGLTDIANAYLKEPKIAERITLIWIGGSEYEGLGIPPPKASKVEYNTGIDIKATQVVFNRSTIPIWQVPRNVYRQALISNAELFYKLRNKGNVGVFLLKRLNDLRRRAKGSLGEAYVLGDSPLALLTALQSSWEQDPSSSKYVIEPAPMVNNRGAFSKNKNGRKIRVYTDIDTRLMFEDFFTKLTLLSE